MSYDEACIDKNAFHKTTTSIYIDEVDINKITLLDKTSYGNNGSFKYHIGYRHKNEALLSPLNIKLPQLTGYTKHFNSNKYVNLLVNDKKLLKKYNEIWDKIKSLFKKEFDKKPFYNNKYISIRFYNNIMHKEFKYKTVLEDNKHCKYIPIEPKDGDCHAYLSTILLDSILVYLNNKHHPQIFFKKCIYAIDKQALLGKYVDKPNDKSNYTLYFFVCKARCKYFFGMIDFNKKIINFFDTLNLSNFNSIPAISTVSSFFA